VAFLLALVLLFGALSLLDRLFGTIDTELLRERYLVHLQQPAVSFLAGVVLTALTTSVAFSLGIVVPLYNRQLITRMEILPFVLGASLGTLSDTLVVAVVLGAPGAVAAVALLLVVGTVLSLGALATYGTYAATISILQDRILTGETTFVAFVASLFLVPLVLVVL
jgi:sodium-dependent phosphate cotransporter